MVETMMAFASWGSWKSRGGDALKGKTQGRRRGTVMVVGECRATDFEVDWSRPAASGSFGEVFFGSHISAGYEVVLKQAKGEPLAKRLLDTERYMNRKLAKSPKRRSGRRYWAEFVGDFERRSKPVLVWRKEGDGSTLEDYLSRRPIEELNRVLGVYDYLQGTFRPGLCKALLKHLVTAIAELQDHGVVHRDVKPANLIVTDMRDETRAPIQIIDFGSAGDFNSLLKRGLQVATCDPLYAAPEQRISPFHPDRFDIYSVGMIGIRALVPALTEEHNLKRFRDSLQDSDSDLLAWASEPDTQINHPWASQWAPTSDPALSPLLTLLARMLRNKPSDRPTVEDLLSNLH